MLLQSYSSFDTLAEYDPESGTLQTFSRTDEPRRASASRPAGMFDTLGSEIAVIYREDDKLLFTASGRTLAVRDFTAEHSLAGDQSVLRLTGAGNVLELRYCPHPNVVSLSDDPTAFAEEEDFDFGLFLGNVFRDTDRQSRLFPREMAEG